MGVTKITEQQIAWIIKKFKNTKNEEIAEKLGLSKSTVCRVARRYGLTKTKQFLKKCQDYSQKRANESHRRNGTYLPKGFIIPNSIATRFEKGVTPEQRLGKKKNQARIEKCAEVRRHTIAVERTRAKYGFPQETKLRFSYTPRRKINQRWYLKSRGYKLDEERCIAYYSEETKRCPKIESKERNFYKFRKYE